MKELQTLSAMAIEEDSTVKEHMEDSHNCKGLTVICNH